MQPILNFGFDLELFQEIKFQISGKVRCGEAFCVRELKILAMNKTTIFPPLAPDLTTKFATHPYTNLVIREYLKQFMWQCLASQASTYF